VSDNRDKGPAPSDSELPPAKHRAGAAAVSVALGIAGLLPYAWVLRLTPMTRDAAIWLDRSDGSSPKLREWLFHTQHFNVGYRPVTGMSYLANDVLGGGMLAYRLTDFALHLTTVGLVHGLVRSWAPRRSPWAATAAAVVMALHPMVGIVVPHLARRGYSLASALSLLGLWLIDRRHPAATALGLATLGAGALANEAAYVAIPVAAMMLVSARRLRELGALGLTLALLLAWRVYEIGGLGGYAVATDRWGRLPSIGLATWTTLLPVGMPEGGLEESLLPGLPLILGSLGLAAGLVAAVVQALRGPEAATPGDAERVPPWNRPELWALAWLAGLTAVYLPNGVWFPRQVYMLVPPLGVLVGLLLGHGLRGAAPGHWTARVVAVLVVLLTLLRTTFVADAQQRVSWEQTDRVTRDLTQTARNLPKEQDLLVVLPFAQRGGQAALRAREGAKRRRQDPLGTRVSHTWASGRVGRRQLDLVAMYLHDPFHEGPELTVDAVPGEARTWRLTLTSPESEWSAGQQWEPMVQGQTLTVSVPDGRKLYVDDGDGGRVLE
jgi:hypothetical protein